jgi:ABC-type transport system involved in multi-copper enzyme maturation permease subunit
MRRSEIVIRRGERERRIVLGRFASLLATIVLAALAIVVLVLAVVFGYIALGIGLAVALIAVVIAVLRGAWSSMRR